MAGAADKGAQFIHGLLQPPLPLGGRQREIKANAAAPLTLEAAIGVVPLLLFCRWVLSGILGSFSWPAALQRLQCSHISLIARGTNLFLKGDQILARYQRGLDALQENAKRTRIHLEKKHRGARPSMVMRGEALRAVAEYGSALSGRDGYFCSP